LFLDQFMLFALRCQIIHWLIMATNAICRQAAEACLCQFYGDVRREALEVNIIGPRPVIPVQAGIRAME